MSADRVNWRPVMRSLLTHIESLPYRGGTRWAFYRALEIAGLGKASWRSFVNVQSRYRKRHVDGWDEDTLTDSVRVARYHGHEPTTWDAWLRRLIDSAPRSGIWGGLPFYVEAWYESEAMSGQFEHYLGEPYRITLRPFRGEASIAFKKSMARNIVTMVKKGKQVTVLYFGDRDDKGDEIPENALKDVRPWCNGAPFRFVPGGLTRDQTTRLQLPENPERPGQWQWEALSDDQAREIILGTLRGAVDVPALEAAVQRADRRTRKWTARAWEAFEAMTRHEGGN